MIEIVALGQIELDEMCKIYIDGQEFVIDKVDYIDLFISLNGVGSREWKWMKKKSYSMRAGKYKGYIFYGSEECIDAVDMNRTVFNCNVISIAKRKRGAMYNKANFKIKNDYADMFTGWGRQTEFGRVMKVVKAFGLSKENFIDERVWERIQKLADVGVFAVLKCDDKRLIRGWDIIRWAMIDCDKFLIEASSEDDVYKFVAEKIVEEI